VDVLAHEPAVRVAIFAAALGLLAAAEARAPRRARAFARRTRWPGNLALPAISALLVRTLLPATAVAAAMLAEERRWGLLHAVGPLPTWLAVPIAVLALDLAIYLQHVLFHAVPILWRLHRMHHADLDVDVTTGARFHPLEILLSMELKIGVIAALGAAPLGVLVFEVLLSAGSLFNHANLRLSPAADRLLRCLVVTPDMHRVHHSVDPEETNRNFGFTLAWWDRLCGTYRAQPGAGHEAMALGIPEFRTARDLRLDRLLLQPFVEWARVRPIARLGRPRSS
jgi:sterol desaturase/sphingolipid hydroxylase (fatty acid hydroxylase superfamily)